MYHCCFIGRDVDPQEGSIHLAFTQAFVYEVLASGVLIGIPVARASSMHSAAICLSLQEGTVQHRVQLAHTSGSMMSAVSALKEARWTIDILQLRRGSVTVSDITLPTFASVAAVRDPFLHLLKTQVSGTGGIPICGGRICMLLLHADHGYKRQVAAIVLFKAKRTQQRVLPHSLYGSSC